MKLQELIDIENEVIAGLRTRAYEGDNEAAKILLEYLSGVSDKIDKWKKDKDAAKGDVK